MRIGTIVMTVLLVLLLASPTFSQYSATESFAYEVGASPDTLLGTAVNGFAGPWDLEDGTAELSTIADAGLTYDDLNYPVSHAGNHLQVNLPGGWVSARYKRPLATTWPDAAGTSYWISLLFETSAIPTGNTYYIVKLYNGTSENIAIGKGGGVTTYTCGSGWPGGPGDDVSSVECAADPVWLVVKIVASGDAGDDVTYMWIDPDPAAEPDIAYSDVVRNTNINDGFNMVAVECGGEDAMTLYWDEIRLGTSYDDVASGATAIFDKKVAPVEYALAQNFPNPFNPATTILYTLQNQVNVHLSVYNMLGEELEVLVNEVQNAGNYIVNFSAADLPSGIYFYRLKTNEGTLTKRMMLLK